MNAVEIKQIRQDLLHLKSELQQQEKTFHQSSAPVELDQARVGRLSRMDAMQVQEMAQEAARRRQHKLLEIEGALLRIESGEYGYCFVCAEEIDMRRLSINPTNTRCMACAK